jgi:UDP-N-acetylglucosamine 4,6-dehydratase
MNVLITGGAGSLGRKLVEELLKHEDVNRIAVFDNHENSIAAMRVRNSDPRLRWFLGDILDKDRLKRAMEGVNVCIHCAAQKHVELGEYSPFFSLQVNVIGTQNCIESAIDANVDKFVFVSSDKAVEPCSVYGKCKSLAESLTLDANNYKGDRSIKLSVVRPCNYFRSDGSVFDVWDHQAAYNEPLTLTSKEMKRYFMEFHEIVQFITKSIEIMQGGEIFVPKNMKLIKIYDLLKEYYLNLPIKIIGLREGERLEELLMTEKEKAKAKVVGDIWVIK